MNGDATTSAAASTATLVSRTSSHANHATASIPAIDSSARTGRLEPDNPSDVAINAGHAGWYLNTTRPSRTPERNGWNIGTCVAAGNVKWPSRTVFACAW